MSFESRILEVSEDESIRRHQIPHRLTGVERRLMKHLSKNKSLITCIGNIGSGKSSLVKILSYSTGMNALFELPDEGFEDHFVSDDAFMPLLSTVKETAKRTLGRYYEAINEFIKCQAKEQIESPAWMVSKRNLERGALDIQHAYLDLRRMQLQTIERMDRSTCVDGSPLADRYAFCEVLNRDMDVPYLTRDGLEVIDKRLETEFRNLKQPDLIIYLHGPCDYLFQNICDRERTEEKNSQAASDLPEGLRRLVNALNTKYDEFIDRLEKANWYHGPVLKIDVSKIDFVSNIRHLIAVFEGIEKLISPDVSTV